MTDADLEALEKAARENLANGTPSDFSPDDVLALVAEVRRLRFVLGRVGEEISVARDRSVTFSSDVPQAMELVKQVLGE
jgi:hypothetical protein